MILEVKKKFENHFEEEQLKQFYQNDKNNLKEIENKEYFKIYEGGLINKYIILILNLSLARYFLFHFLLL